MLVDDERAALSRDTNVNIDTNFSGEERVREGEIASVNVAAQDSRAAVRK